MAELNNADENSLAEIAQDIRILRVCPPFYVILKVIDSICDAI
jgi:hypothetical protein